MSNKFLKWLLYLSRLPIFPYFFLSLITIVVYYKLFLLGKIPFPGDLLIGSYSPWFDYYKMPIQNPLISDIFSQFFLWKYLTIDSFLKFQWPLWNPYSFTGTPLLATYHSATLYPLNILLLFPKYIGWGLFIFSQTLIAALTMYLFLKNLLGSKLASILGAVIFAFSSLMTTWLEFGTAVHAMSWLPLGFLSVELYIKKGKFRYLLLLIISLTLTILAGHAQITTYSFILINLFSIFRSWNQNVKIFLKTFLFLFISQIFAILISSLQFFPSFELLRQSIRLTESYTGEFNFGLLTLTDSLKFFVGDFFGNSVTRNYWGNLNYSETSAFVGTLSLPLLIYAYMYLKKTSLSIFFLTLLPISLILSFNNPISHSIYSMKIPLLTSSYASRMLFVVSFLVSIICAFSLDKIMSNPKDIKKFVKTTLWSLAALLGIILGTKIAELIISDIISLAPSREYLKIYLANQDYALANFSVSERNTIIPLLLISISFLFFILITKIKFLSKNSAVIIPTLVLLFTLSDLGRYFIKFNPFVSQNLIFPTVPALEFLQKQPGLFRVGREHAEVFPPNTWIAYNLQSYEGYDPIYLNNYGKFMHFLNGGDIRTGNSTRYAEVASDYRSPYLDAANTKFFIAILRDKNGYIPGDLLNFRVKETEYEMVFRDKSAAVLKNPRALERAYLAPSILTVSESKVGDLMMDKDFDPLKKIALSENLNINSVTGNGEVKVSYYSPNLVEIITETKLDEVLVLSDQYEKGWKAKIDGQETKISRANFIFRAVKIPAGKHRITFYYWPASFELGMKVSIASVIFLGLITFWTLKRKIF